MNQQTNALRANESIARNLRILAVIGLLLIVSLVVTLLAVQIALGRQLNDLEVKGVAGASAIARLEKASGGLHSRQTQLVGTTTSAELASIPARNQSETEMLSALDALKQLHPDKIAAVEAEARAFLSGDDALYQSLQQRHTLNEASIEQRKATETSLRGLVESAMGLAGVARLQSVLLLRDLNKDMGSQTIAREVIFGDARVQQEAVAEVVRGVLGLGGLVGKVGLAQNNDLLNAIVANELPQNAAATRVGLQKLVEVTSRDPEKQAQATALLAQWEALFSQVADDAREGSLVQLRRAILAQQTRSQTLRQEAQASVAALHTQLAVMEKAVEAAIASSQAGAKTVIWYSRVATIALVLLGVGGVLYSRRRIQGSVEALQTSNQELERMGRELADINLNLEGQVRERTAQLATREASLRLILDSTGDGLIRLDLQGRVVGEASQAAAAWLGPASAGQAFASLLFPRDPNRAKELTLGFEQFADDFLPFELIADQLPARLERAERHLGISWRPINEDNVLAGVLVTISDVTAAVEGERAEQRARELQLAVSQLLKNPAGFQLFLQDGAQLIEQCAPTSPRDGVLRALHTIKGNCAVMGFLGVARVAHEIEDELAEASSASISDTAATRLRDTWQEALGFIEGYIQKTPDLSISPEDISELLRQIAENHPHGALKGTVERWKLTPARVLLNRLADQSQRLAQRLNRPTEVWVDGGLVRLEEKYYGFISSLIHVVRNALDHGIEDEAVRLARGKAATGQLRLQMKESPTALTVEVQDDGGGIAWDAVERKGRRMARPVETGDDLITLLFTDGFSTRDAITEVSGRGVGLGAVRALVESLSGTIEVLSTPERGATFRFVFPRGSNRAGA